MLDFFQVSFTKTAWSVKHGFRVSTRCYWLPAPPKPLEGGTLVAQIADHPDSLRFVADVEEGKDGSSWSFLPKKRSMHSDQTGEEQKHGDALKSFLLQCSHSCRLEIKCPTDLLSASWINRLQSAACSRCTESKEGSRYCQRDLCNLTPEGSGRHMQSLLTSAPWCPHRHCPNSAGLGKTRVEANSGQATRNLELPSAAL